MNPTSLPDIVMFWINTTSLPDIVMYWRADLLLIRYTFRRVTVEVSILYHGDLTRIKVVDCLFSHHLLLQFN